MAKVCLTYIVLLTHNKNVDKKDSGAQMSSRMFFSKLINPAPVITETNNSSYTKGRMLFRSAFRDFWSFITSVHTDTTCVLL